MKQLLAFQARKKQLTKYTIGMVCFLFSIPIILRYIQKNLLPKKEVDFSKVPDEKPGSKFNLTMDLAEESPKNK